MKRSLITIAVCFAAFSCGPRDKALTIKGVDYRFPASHEPAVTSEQEGAFGAFARVKPPGEPFHLIYSQRHYRPNKQGGDIPTIHWVNDANADAIVRIEHGETAVCAKAHPLQHFTCGIRVMDANLRWAAVFDRDQVANAATIHARAAAYLKAYRRAAGTQN